MVGCNGRADSGLTGGAGGVWLVTTLGSAPLGLSSGHSAGDPWLNVAADILTLGASAGGASVVSGASGAGFRGKGPPSQGSPVVPWAPTQPFAPSFAVSKFGC